MFRLVVCALVVLSMVAAKETKHRNANPQVAAGVEFGSTYHAGLVVGDLAPRYADNQKTAALTCNGVFIERDWVLTSRSCLQNTAQDRGVVFSSSATLNNDLIGTYPIYTVYQAIPHDDANVNLALLQVVPRAGNKDQHLFDSSKTRPTPLVIADASPSNGATLSVSGYGCHEQYNADEAPCSPGMTLRRTDATVQDAPTGADVGTISEPIDAENESLFWTENVMCYKDLGGPALNDAGELVGVFAGASQGCGDSNGWSSFTDVTRYREWISEYTGCGDLQVITTNAARAMETDVYACFQVDYAANLPSELRLMFPSAEWQLQDASLVALEGVEPKVDFDDALGNEHADKDYETAVTSDEFQIRFPAPFEYTEDNFSRRVKLYLTGVVNPNNCDSGKYAATAWPCRTFNLMNADPPVWVRRCGAEPVSVQVQGAGNSYSDATPCLFCDRDGAPHNTPRGCSLCNSCKLLYTTTDSKKVYKCESDGLTMFRTDVPDGSNNENFCDPMSNGKGPMVADNPYSHHLAMSG